METRFSEHMLGGVGRSVHREFVKIVYALLCRFCVHTSHVSDKVNATSSNGGQKGIFVT